MPGVRDHNPIVIEDFGGWWQNGDPESVPSDHFVVADNVQYFNSGVETRIPLDKYQAEAGHLTSIRRVYNYVMHSARSLLVLNNSGQIYHFIPPSTVHGPILSIPTMEDFGFVAIAGRAYITPFKSQTTAQGVTIDLGIPGEFLYVYKGDGTPARKAAGDAPNYIGLRPFLAYPSETEGVVTKGVHLVMVTNGNLLGPEVFPVVEMDGTKQIQLDGIPNVLPGTRKIIMTKAIPPENYKANVAGLTFYEAATITDPAIVSMKINVPDSGLTAVYVPTAGSQPTTGALQVNNTDTDGFCDIGFHLVGVVYETDTGYLTKPGPMYTAKIPGFGGQTYIDTKRSVTVFNIPTAPVGAHVVKRHLVSTKAIPEYNGDPKGYQMFFIPGGTIDDNTTTSKTINYYDSDLVSDASHLMDNYSEIPAGVNLNTYHSRLVLVGDPTFPKKADGTPDTSKPDNRSVARVSAPGEPEAISEVDGLIVTPLDGNPLTNCQEFRDVLYLFKKNRTYAYTDNFDEPATWQEKVVDQGVGTSVHGITTVLDSGGVNIDYLIVADRSGMVLFNGTYARPELSWKIRDYWMGFDHNNFRQVQLINDSLNKRIVMVLPAPHRNHVLYADYGNGLDAKSIKWARWIFRTDMSTVTLIEVDKIVFGALKNTSLVGGV